MNTFSAVNKCSSFEFLFLSDITREALALEFLVNPGTSC